MIITRGYYLAGIARNLRYELADADSALAYMYVRIYWRILNLRKNQLFWIVEIGINQHLPKKKEKKNKVRASVDKAK